MSNTDYALDLINDERVDQIYKHGFTNDHALAHPEDYSHGEQANAAAFALTGEDKFWPSHWHNHYKDKISTKSKINRLVVAGALIAAEIERLHSIRHDHIANVSKEEGASFEDWKADYIAAGIADGLTPDHQNNLDWNDLELYYEAGSGALDCYKDQEYV